MTKQYGYFFIVRELFESDLESIQKIMKEVVVLKAEMEFCRDAIRYEAWSDHFRCLSDGERLPKYSVQLNRNGSVLFDEDD